MQVRGAFEVHDASGAHAGVDRVRVADSLSDAPTALDVREYDELARWIRQRSGLATWGDDVPVELTRRDPRWLGGLGATVRDGVARIVEGPWELEDRARAAAGFLGHHRDAINAKLPLVDAARTALRTHELTHVGTGLAWGEPELRTAGLDALAAFEDRAVDEAVADLMGASRRGRRDLGIRLLDDVSELVHVDEPRGGFAAGGRGARNAYGASMLLSGPMSGIGRTHGWGALAAITGETIRGIGAGLTSGELRSVSLDAAARIAHGVLGDRLGEADLVVAAIRDVWTGAGLLR